MLSRQEEDRERRETLRNDLKVRRQEEQGSAYIDHYTQDMGGRFASVGAATVVGADPIPNYPAAAAHQHDPCGPEPSLGYRIDDPSDPVEASFFTQQATGEPADAPPLAERVGSPLSHGGSAPEEFPSSGKRGHAAGPSHPFRR
jgi:hypothetical protein